MKELNGFLIFNLLKASFAQIELTETQIYGGPSGREYEGRG
jgi:hypothetical protein